MAFKPDYLPGASELDQEEFLGLISKTVSTQFELNLLESQNVHAAQLWLTQTKRDILTEEFARRLHLKMFCDVWLWAGSYRKAVKNFGALPPDISARMQAILGDTHHWIKTEKYEWPQILAIFHYSLVSLQPFANGNGRHARLYTNALATMHKQKVPTWGESLSGELHLHTPRRTQYIAALKQADGKKLSALLEFLYL